LTICRNSRSTSWLLRVSSAPVGSSASTASGRVTNARAMATRCCWPPDSSFGRRSMYCVMPTRSSNSRSHASFTCVPDNRGTSVMF